MPADMPPTGGQGPVAIVTGAGSGIGRATALRLGLGLRLGLDGYRVTLAGRRKAALQETPT